MAFPIAPRNVIVFESLLLDDFVHIDICKLWLLLISIIIKRYEWINKL